MTSAEIKKLARSLGADAVGIGNIERWEGAPLQMDPRQIMPEARSVVAMAFRVMRGSLRGVEEGTFFSNYSAMGYGGITYLYMPMTVINLSKAIEDEGCEAVPMGHQSDWRAIDGIGRLRRDYSRPVRPGQAAPDVMIQLRIASFLCGLGEIGYSKMLLTPQFGPRQRVGIVITDMELEPDPLYPDTDGPKLCDRCMACVRECPAGAISRTQTVRVNLAGHWLEWGEIDCDACDIAFRGGLAADGPVTGAAEYNPPMYGKSITQAPWTPFHKKPRNLYNTGQAVCGARGCTRACMINLEGRGVLENRFRQPFRRRPPWQVDWSQPVALPEGVPMAGRGGPASSATHPDAKEAD
ncbi:MAG: 4Fe-4S binding protein [Lentisphaeria bacterium]|nr:4Fe-4S binding protein [Lentisphaeria bacterium]